MTAIETTPPSREEWDRIGGAMAPEFRFLTSNWFEPWGQHLLASIDGWHGPLRYLTARNEEGRIVGVLPLATQRKSKVQFLALGGNLVPLRGYPVMTAAAADAAHAFARHLTDHPEGVGFRFGPVTDDDPVTSPFTAALRQRGWRFVPLGTERRQIIQLPNTLPEYEAGLSASELKNIRRRERKMQRERKVDLRSFTSETCDDWNPVIRDMAQIEEQSWLPKLGGDLHFPGDANRDYWNGVLSGKREGLRAQVWILYLDEAPVAYDFNIDSGSCRYSLFAHYAEQAKVYHPGYLLKWFEVEDAIARGIRTIDMGAGDPGNKGFWGTKPQGSLLDTLAFPPGIRGAVLMRLAAAIPALERARARTLAATARATAFISTISKALEFREI